MLENEKVVLLVIGAVFFLIGLLGGGVEVSAVKIPTVSKYPRVTFLVVGSALLGLAMYRILFPAELGVAVPPGAAPSPDLSLTQVPTPSALPVESTATLTPEPDLTPTASPTPPLAVNMVFSDDFETSAGVWVTGEQSLSSSTEKKSISYGKYVWELTAGQSVFSSELPDAPVVSDFELQAELRLVSGPEDAAYGLIFRSSENGVYSFNITRGAFWLGFLDKQNQEWYYPTELIASSAINQNGPNILKVVAKGSNIQLFINGQFVRTVSDSRSLSGKTGISVSLYKAEDTAKLEVDDFYLTELRE
jgi:hypothetical protein